MYFTSPEEKVLCPETYNNIHYPLLIFIYSKLKGSIPLPTQKQYLKQHAIPKTGATYEMTFEHRKRNEIMGSMALFLSLTQLHAS